MTVPSFDDALAYAKKRKVVLPSIFYDPKNKDQHGNLMTVSHLAGLAQIQAIADDLMKALENGETFEQWQQRALNTPGVGALPPGRLETIFRNYIQTAYNGGRWAQFEQNKLAVPYLMFSAINDARVTEICRARNGIIREVDDPFWKTNSPMLHHRCRSTLIALTAGQAKARSSANSGLNKDNPTLPAQPGWGYKPTVTGVKKSLKDQFTERLKKAPSWLQKIIEQIFKLVMP